MQTKEQTGIYVHGHIKIWEPETGEVWVNKSNAIHYENMSIALANSFANSGKGFVYKMRFGNGGTSVDPTGIITYLTPNTTGSNADVYSYAYEKVVDPNSAINVDPTRNFTEVRHATGTNYSDVFVTCLLDYGEPSGQSAYDTTANGEQTFVFDELGLVGHDPNNLGADGGPLLTHVIFHPVQKSLNRLIQIDYTVRIQSLTGLVSV